ncbi:peptidoglycan DD-metalloendopeptidase family protein [Paenibacillus wynnii]|uniref:peptidoglycan DD-metalloendopeptidase family protein n=1 Tax=Paenibacillus wynnii TaxID=268407 RepID=UPI002793D4D6|nr:peptidoglycan DD-metalloendopeptidase family protein [Paenibacillus wynnii]MDQ0194004.1 murein DD-endopeptidase MepM/ murein hydrolase activator NlpD [Paenibacillus wynnii]
MKSQPDHNQITLLVVRDAGRPVRQLRISKPLAFAIPAAAALSISSLVTSMHYHSSQSIAQLEAEAAALSLHNLRMEIQVADKEEALQQLQMEVTDLSEEADNIKDKLKSVSELEQQLQSLIQKQNSPDSKESNNVTTSSSSGVINHPVKLSSSSQVGGEYIAVYNSEAVNLVQETKDDFAEIRSILEEMVNSIPVTISQAKKADTLQATKITTPKSKLSSAVMWPTLSKVITSSFGYRTDPFKGSSAFHSGIDIAGDIGDPVFSAQDGEVITVDQKGARGKFIVIKHSNGLETWYMHLSSMNVSPGEKVVKGQKIGGLGSTGRSTGPHLHFQVVKQNKPVNPMGYIQQNS